MVSVQVRGRSLAFRSVVVPSGPVRLRVKWPGDPVRNRPIKGGEASDRPRTPGGLPDRDSTFM